MCKKEHPPLHDSAALVSDGTVSEVVHTAHERLRAAPLVQAVLADIEADDGRALDELCTISEIPAPPFKEAERAAYFLQRLQELGIADAYIDSEGNAIGLRKGTGAAAGQAPAPKLLVSAHLDTVFAEGTDVTVTKRDGLLFGPGVGDNGRGLAVLLSWLTVLNKNNVQTVGDLLFVANVGEEGAGDLRGIKALLREHQDIDGTVGFEPRGQAHGDPDEITTRGIGSHRYRFHFKGPGGHSFEHYGLPSAIHAMGRAIASIAEIRTATEPKTTCTVGVVAGGTTVNAIAGLASMDVDIRSGDMANLLDTERQILAAVDAAVLAENQRWNSTVMTVERVSIGDRPAGSTPTNAPIVQTFVKAMIDHGRRPPTFAAHSADANVPMSLGIPAVTIANGGDGGEHHTLKEWLDPHRGWEEAQIGLLGVLALVGVADVCAPLLARRSA